jgi:hypothetical protein
MLGNVVANAVNAGIEATPIARTETFESQTGVGFAPARTALVSLITFLIIFAAILVLGKWLWNSVLVALVPAVKPAKSVWQILGLAILLSLMAPGNCC